MSLLPSIRAPAFPGAILGLHMDTESAAGPTQLMSALCEIGIVAIAEDSPEREKIFEYSACLKPLVLFDDDKVKSFWETPSNEGHWEYITTNPRDRIEVAEELRDFVKHATALKWKIHVYMRPAAYDWAELRSFFNTLGIEKALGSHSEICFNLMCDKIMTPFPVPPNDEKYKETAYFPFGFGGAGDVTDVGQRVLGACQAHNLKLIGFNDVMDYCIPGRVKVHQAMQDAVQQAQAWYAFVDACSAGRFVEFHTGIMNMKK